jgi:hypothetical protein
MTEEVDRGRGGTLKPLVVRSRNFSALDVSGTVQVWVRKSEYSS